VPSAAASGLTETALSPKYRRKPSSLHLPPQRVDLFYDRMPPRVHAVLSAVGVLASPLWSLQPQPHPTHADRLVTDLGGWHFEYSPGHEAYVEALGSALSQWGREDQPRPPEADVVVPLSAKDLQARRTEFLSLIAYWIGLNEPTPLQEACYDTFVNHYLLEATGHIVSQRLLPEFVLGSPRLALWDEAELKRRLIAGESIAGWTYDSAEDSVRFAFGVEAAHRPDEQEHERLQRLSQGLQNSLSYDVKEGVAQLSASVTFELGQAAKSPAPLEFEHALQALREKMQQQLLWAPIIVGGQDGDKQDPRAVAAEHVQFRRDLATAVRTPVPWSPPLALAVLHETTEIGLLERYIGSPDRRWLCDGTANWVSWRVARDLAGHELAKKVYDLDDQLMRFATYQQQVRLRAWPAVEVQPEPDRTTELNRAHYPFATRVVALMVEKHREDALPQLWREIGRTARSEVTMGTVEQVYRKLTRHDLNDLIRDAERRPLSSAEAPSPTE
jgi:hypothetical protein